MKKHLSIFLSLLLVLNLFTGIFVLAEGLDGSNASRQEVLFEAVADYLVSYGYDYEFNDDIGAFVMQFAIDSTLDNAETQIYAYEDLIYIFVLSPIEVGEKNMDKVAIYLSLVNNILYYGSFNMDRNLKNVYCYSYIIADEQTPQNEDINTLLAMPLYYMDVFGDGLHQVSENGLDPYDAFDMALDRLDE